MTHIALVRAPRRAASAILTAAVAIARRITADAGRDRTPGDPPTWPIIAGYAMLLAVGLGAIVAAVTR